MLRFLLSAAMEALSGVSRKSRDVFEFRNGFEIRNHWVWAVIRFEEVKVHLPRLLVDYVATVLRIDKDTLTMEPGFWHREVDEVTSCKVQLGWR